MPTLKELIEFVEQNYLLNAKTLHMESLPDANASQMTMIKIRHLHLHICKQSGTLAGVIEHFEHTGEMSVQGAIDMRIATAKMMINLLLAVSELGMSDAELELMMQKVFEDNRQRAT